MKTAALATYHDHEAEVYTLADLARIAETIWHGQRRRGFVRTNETKWCDADAVGVTMRKACFVTTAAEWRMLYGYTWLALANGLTIYIETNSRGAFAGRFHVRKETLNA